MKAKLTKQAVDGFKPQARQFLVWDSTLIGFGLLVNPSGAKSFVAQRSIRGRGVRVTVGRYGVLSVDQARNKARKMLDMMADGKNPREEERKTAAKSLTLHGALALTLATARSKKRSERTIKHYEALVNRCMSQWLDREMREIGEDRKGVADLHRRITGKHGAATANQALGTLRTVYNRAARQHPELPQNPVYNVDFHPMEPKERAIPEALLPRWVERIAAMLSPVRRDFYMVALFTGLRSESIRMIRWEHVDLEKRALFIPRPKGGEKRAFLLPLSDHLCELLEARKKAAAVEAPGSPWAFPSRGKYLADARLSGKEDERWRKFDKPGEEPLPIFPPHSCRHTYRTAAHSAEVDPYSVQLLMNHTLPKGGGKGNGDALNPMSARYLSAEFETLRRAQERITQHLLGVIEPKNAKVTPMRRTRRKAG